MNFDKESKSEEKKNCSKGSGGGGGGGGGRLEWREGGFQSKKKCIHLLFVLMLYVKFQVPSSSGSLVLTQTKRLKDR